MSAVELARQQLTHILGADHGHAALDDCLRRTGLDAVHTADELMRLAECLMQKGGIVEVVGRSLKLQALRQGARLA
jgi:hypothetical protein